MLKNDSQIGCVRPYYRSDSIMESVPPIYLFFFEPCSKKGLRERTLIAIVWSEMSCECTQIAIWGDRIMFDIG